MLKRLTFVGLCMALAGGCARNPELSLKPNVFLISLDTLRRDAVGAYSTGGSSPTPEIDRFSEQCVRFDQAWAPIPFTLSSHMSLFTGLHPKAHGVRTREHTLDENIPTIAELAARAGYRNIGLVSNIWMKATFGFDRGFEHYEQIPPGLTFAGRINKRAFELLDQIPEDDPHPIFAFLHYNDAHSDYHNPKKNTLPYFAPAELISELGVDAIGAEFCDEDGNCATDFLTVNNRTNRHMEHDVIDRIEALYSAGVRHLDHHIGALVRGLDERGLLDGALLIITSDHGEEFREHGRFLHAQPYVENLAVPLLVRFPGGAKAGHVVDNPVELADLMPSILAVMSVEQPEHLPSRDCFTPILDSVEIAPSPVLGADKIRNRRFALRNHRYTLITDFSNNERELFDRSIDPHEDSNLILESPELANRLAAEAGSVLREHRLLGGRLRIGHSAQSTDALSDEEAEQLRAIGYLE